MNKLVEEDIPFAITRGRQSLELGSREERNRIQRLSDKIERKEANKLTGNS